MVNQGITYALEITKGLGQKKYTRLGLEKWFPCQVDQSLDVYQYASSACV